MTPVKKFFLVYFGVYIAVGIAFIVLWGPPGLSADYLEQYKEDQDRYLRIVKSNEYKLWAERPHLHPEPTGADFVAEYEANPAFQEEQRRRAVFNTAFDFWNFLAVTYLIVHFGRKPFLAFLDDRIALLRTKIENAERARQSARRRMDKAQAQYDTLEEERRELEQFKAEQIEANRAEYDKLAQENLAEIDREIEDRKQEERHRARLKLKAELIDAALARVVSHIKETPSSEEEARLVDKFIDQLENRQWQ